MVDVIFSNDYTFHYSNYKTLFLITAVLSVQNKLKFSSNTHVDSSPIVAINFVMEHIINCINSNIYV